MINIYIQSSTIVLLQESELRKIYGAFDTFELIAYKKKEQLKSIIDRCENQTLVVAIIANNLDKLKSAFQSNFSLHIAGGGLVVHPSNKILLMYRRGFWDLPKGHQEEGESIQGTALREVMEETGIKHLKLGNPIIINESQQNITYHTYRTKKNKHVLKESHWFEMFSQQEVELIPQTEEDIEKLEWVEAKKIRPFLEKAYENIRDVINAYNSKP